MPLTLELKKARMQLKKDGKRGGIDNAQALLEVMPI